MNERYCAMRVLLAASILVAAAGCGTLPDGSRWGQDAFSSFESNRIAGAAKKAFWHPNTLGPLAGAAVFAIDDFDERASDWAVKHTPLFGSESDARDASDDLKLLLAVETLVTALATPSGDDVESWTRAKLKGMAVEAGAVAATQGLTGLLKSATDRERPDRSNDNSFPSAHSSSAFAYATLSNRNLDHIDVPPAARNGLQVGNVLTAGGVAWARVEGRKHYPSDVLFGAALGHFLAAFIHDAFLNLPGRDEIRLTSLPVEAGAGVQLAVRF
ncbi:MAG: phosphatase PAP2 family protein [Phycisphaerales bacterium]|nr:MAG: phosphatase PAP2 family protein [Phycisphaerales bacterium]